MNEEHSIAGGWLGTYRYRRTGQEPVRFEASFAARSDGGFSGTIIDDCYLGEAAAGGTQTGRTVEFTKTYLSPPDWSVTGPVAYEGVMSEDGKRMTGKWRLDLSAIYGRRRHLSGVWDARRMWNAPAEEQEVEEPEVYRAGRELVEVRR